MSPRAVRRIPLVAAALALAAAAGLAVQERAQEEEEDAAARMRRVLWERTGPDGRTWGADALDPLLWSVTRGLLEGPWHDEARAAVEAFLASGDAAVPEEPLARALLQRDLLAVFAWLAARAQEPERAERALALAAPLARAIEHLALAVEEIAALPSTVPAELLDEDGPWVRLAGAGSASLAPTHETFTGARSAFDVLVALPAGREAALAWAALLGGAAVVEGSDGRYRLPPEVELPEGARVALLRRAVLVDRSGVPRLTGIAEAFQVREFVELGEPSDDPALEMELRGQEPSEQRLDRASLLAGGTGLRALGPDDESVPVFMSHALDPFEWRDGAELGRWSRPVLATCGACHRGPGVASLASVAGFASWGEEPWRPPRLRAEPASVPRANEHEARARGAYELGLLRGLSR